MQADPQRTKNPTDALLVTRNELPLDECRISARKNKCE